MKDSVGNMQALSKLLLNNWHYIDEKQLSFHEGINFFTGHSGSGKSTVIDALQIVLYADTDGRGFFNKAAKDDSNRTLLEYLRGMNNVGENGQATYLRNHNFSSTIVLEFQNIETKECQSIGVIFDVDVTVHEVNRMFFMHTGPLLTNHYRQGGHVMTILELKDYLKQNYTENEWDYSRTNEKFRAKLYETYLGGIDAEKFMMLFKKSISFRMDTKLEDFVKEYVCMKKDIHIEDMTESVTQYGRLKRKLEDTKHEIQLLQDIQKKYQEYEGYQKEEEQYQYNIEQFELDRLERELIVNQEKTVAYEQDIKSIKEKVASLDLELETIQKQQVQVKYSIEQSGYDHLEEELQTNEDMIRHLSVNQNKYEQIAVKLNQWMNYDNETYHTWLQTQAFGENEMDMIHHFARYQITTEEINHLKETFATMMDSIKHRMEEAKVHVDQIERETKEYELEMNQLSNGQKAYPHYVLEAKDIIEKRLAQMTNRQIPVRILADEIDVKEDRWRDAVEGFMGNNKLLLVVEPAYVATAMEIYEGLDKKKYHRVALLDTDRITKYTKKALKGSLATEVDSDLPYVLCYVDFLMGNLMKCETVNELRSVECGITPDCYLYHGFKLQQMNPVNYTEQAYIGQHSIEQRFALIKQKIKSLIEQQIPYKNEMDFCKRILSFETLNEDCSVYQQYMTDIKDIAVREEKKKEILLRLNEIKEKDLALLQQKERQLHELWKQKSDEKSHYVGSKISIEKMMVDLQKQAGQLQHQHNEKVSQITIDHDKNLKYDEFISKNQTLNDDRMVAKLYACKNKCVQQLNTTFEQLIQLRGNYQKSYGYRGFSLESRDNKAYDDMLSKLECDQLQSYMEKAAEQALKATHHFKTDFIYKIRDAMKEALQQKDELNRILKQTDFGKEKYRFVIEKNRGEDGKFYKMFMDDTLEINPGQLTNHMDNQMDLFSTKHEDRYHDLMNELLTIFMPLDSDDEKMSEEARRNIEKYADYRTYLSFDMEQVIDGMPPMRLSKMLTKNSGGEGQNPLYVALLASFAGVYRISGQSKRKRRSTPRLVVLDEAFSKMDGEKVASCVELMRKLGFQSIISATNDKIQNYVESVDKTLVLAKPNKTHISIQPFEKREFVDLIEEHE